MIQTRLMDNDKARELLVLISANYVGTTLQFTINNSGTISGQVVRLWVQDSSGSSSSAPITNKVLLPNDELTITGTATGAASTIGDRFWFETARGNQFTYLIQGGKGQDGRPLNACELQITQHIVQGKGCGAEIENLKSQQGADQNTSKDGAALKRNTFEKWYQLNIEGTVHGKSPFLEPAGERTTS